jgi:hypothetical protein
VSRLLRGLYQWMLVQHAGLSGDDDCGLVMPTPASRVGLPGLQYGFLYDDDDDQLVQGLLQRGSFCRSAGRCCCHHCQDWWQFLLMLAFAEVSRALYLSCKLGPFAVVCSLKCRLPSPCMGAGC